jgi:trehalose synthase
MEVTNITDISLDSYKDIITDELYNDLLEKVKPFVGKTVVHFNATPIGGGVAELLQGLVPLMRSVGINTRWFVIPSKFESFFKVTKKIHNCLQGAVSSELTKEDEKIYMETSRQLAELMKDIQADYWFVHDPQPLGAISYLAQKRTDFRAIWRCHIDLADASCNCWHWLEKFVRHCDITIFSMEEFVPRGFRSPHFIMFPAIDPLRPKNKEMSNDEAKGVLRYFGVDTNRPVIAQVSRFDPWKDPVGVIQAYQLAKEQIPDLQLILMGLIQAQDDPEQEEYLRRSKEYAGDDKDVFFIADPNNLPADNDTVVNAVQSGSDIIIQKSLREGFGLVVTEAMWKGKAIIAGR